MTMLDSITPLVITYDEEPNIGRVLEKLTWARRIVIIDSGSTDATQDIVKTFPNTEIHVRPFDSFARQCNFGLGLIGGGWVLSLDADYVLSDELIDEMSHLSAAENVAGYRVPFIYCIEGRKLRGTLYPPRTVLYRAGSASYTDEGHGHRVKVNGLVRDLAAPILHDDRKPLARWFHSQQSYARKEAEFLLAADKTALGRNDRLRLMAWPAPMLVLFYTLFVKRTILDGWPGWFYALQRLLAETLIALELMNRRLRPAENGTDSPTT